MVFPSTDLDIIVEVCLGADPTDDPVNWPAPTDFSSRLVRKPIQIRRGRGQNQKTAQAGACTLWLDNTDGALTPFLASATYYPDWGLGVPLRVSVDGVGAVPPYVRHAGFIADISAVMVPGTDGVNISAVRVTSTGVLRRLTQGAVAKSVLQRFIQANDPYAYWALDDGPLSVAGVLTDGVGGPFTAELWAGGGGVNPGSAEVAPWLGPGLQLDGVAAAVLAQAQLATVLAPASRLILDATLLVNLGSTDDQVISFGIFDRRTNINTTASQTRCWVIQLDFAAGTISPLLVAAFGAGVVLTSGSTVAFDATIPHHLRMDLSQNGANIDAIAYLDGVIVGSGTLAANTLTAFAFQFVRLLHTGQTTDIGASVVFTDVTLWVDVAPPAIAIATMASAVLGFTGEQAHARIARNCAEEGISYSGNAIESHECGPQPIDTAVGVFQDCETVDHGMLVEDMAFGLDYRAMSQRLNLNPSVTVDLSTYRTTAGTQADVLTPVRNDARIRNEWTVSRPDGSEATATDPTNIAKRGRYNDSASVNVADDAALFDEASWRVHEGTFDGLRYDTVPLDIAANQ